MKKAILITMVLGVVLLPLAYYVGQRRIERQNDASDIRGQYNALQIAFSRGDFTNALETYFTPTYRNLYSVGSGSFDHYVSKYRWVTNLEHALHPRAYVEFSGNRALLFPTKSEDAPDICVELQKMDGRWLFNGKVIATVD